MEYRQLGRSGLRVSTLALGTATFGGKGALGLWGATDVAGARRLIDRCVDAGVNLVDTADAYSSGLSEEILGEALQGGHADVLVATKARLRMGDGPNDAGLSRHHLIEACEASLRRLRRDHIDLYQVHTWDGQTPLEETLSALDVLVRSGKVRYIGCSNFSGWQLMKAAGVADRRGYEQFVAQQIYLSLQSRDAEHEMMPAAIDLGVGTLVWSPLAGGLLSGKFAENDKGPEGARRTNFDFPPIDRPRAFKCVEAMRPIASAHGVSVARIALAWLLHQPAVASVIVGAKTKQQLTDNIASTDVRLNEDELKSLAEASQLPPEYPGWMFARQNLDRFPGGRSSDR